MSEFNRIQGCPCGAGTAESAVCPASARSRENGTCCKSSLREALRLLCSDPISDAVDFDAFAFLTEANAVGAEPQAMGDDDVDNLGTLSGTFRRFTPGTCDLIDVEGQVRTPYGLTVDAQEASLCSLSAIAFQLSTPATDESQSTACCAETAAAQFRRIRGLLQNALEAPCGSCGTCRPGCDCRDDCRCSEGILRTLSDLAMNKRTTLTAGQLSLRNATALGTVGTVLVLSNETDYRFYFVCAEKVEFLA